jgi:hypothetical protein
VSDRCNYLWCGGSLGCWTSRSRVFGLGGGGGNLFAIVFVLTSLITLAIVF